MADYAGRLRYWLAAMAANRRLQLILLCYLLVVGLWFLMGSRADKNVSAPIMNEKIITLQPFAATVTVAGRLIPGDAISLTAPFDGRIAKLKFIYGERVEAGQILFEMDGDELAQLLNDATANLLKAKQIADDHRNWASGPQMSQARRNLATAQNSLDNLTIKLAETVQLLESGLVPRSEYDALAQQVVAQKITVAAANEELATVLQRGQGVNRQVAAIELINAQAKLRKIEQQLAHRQIRAPVAGVIVRPPVVNVDASSSIHVGQQVSHGQLIGSIAREGGLSFAFNLDETDLNHIRVGKKLTVSGPGFDQIILSGQISSIASEAVASGNGDRSKASFAVLARLDPLTSAQAKSVRIGMSAHGTITTYQARKAIVVPPAAIRGALPNITILVASGAEQQPREKPVTAGHVTASGVEIIAGLRPGDRIFWPAPALADESPP